MREGGGTTPGIVVAYNIRCPQIAKRYGSTEVSHKRFRLPNSVFKITPCVLAHLKAVIPTDVKQNITDTVPLKIDGILTIISVLDTWVVSFTSWTTYSQGISTLQSEWEAGWAPQLACAFRRREIFLVSNRTRTTIPRSSNLQLSHNVPHMYKYKILLPLVSSSGPTRQHLFRSITCTEATMCQY